MCFAFRWNPLAGKNVLLHTDLFYLSSFKIVSYTQQLRCHGNQIDNPISLIQMWFHYTFKYGTNLCESNCESLPETRKININKNTNKYYLSQICVYSITKSYMCLLTVFRNNITDVILADMPASLGTSSYKIYAVCLTFPHVSDSVWIIRIKIYKWRIASWFEVAGCLLSIII